MAGWDGVSVGIQPENQDQQEGRDMGRMDLPGTGQNWCPQVEFLLSRKPQPIYLYLSISISMSIPISICISISAYLYIYISIYIPVSIYVSMSLCLYVSIYHLSIYLSMYIYSFFRFFSLIGYYKILDIIPCAIQQVLVVYLIYIQQYVCVNPKLLIYLPPLHPLWKP